MVHVRIVERIDRPIHDVFERLADIDGYSAWMPDNGLFVSCSQETEGPVDVGTRYVDRTKLGTVHGEVVELVRPTRIVYHYTARLLGRTAMEGWPGYTLERAPDDTTRVVHEARGRLFGAFRILQPLVQVIARGERQRTVDALDASFADNTARN